MVEIDDLDSRQTLPDDESSAYTEVSATENETAIDEACSAAAGEARSAAAGRPAEISASGTSLGYVLKFPTHVVHDERLSKAVLQKYFIAKAHVGPGIRTSKVISAGIRKFPRT